MREEQMTVVSFRIPAKLKKSMKRVRKNWSHVVRESIENEIKEKRKHQIIKKVDAILSHTHTTKIGTAAKLIREDRDSH